MNNGYLDEKFDADPRPGVVASLTASSLSKMQYQQRLDALHTLHNCDTLPTKEIHIKSFSSSTPIKSKAPCHNFARGSCKFGDTCKYAHGDLTSIAIPCTYRTVLVIQFTDLVRDYLVFSFQFSGRRCLRQSPIAEPSPPRDL